MPPMHRPNLVTVMAKATSPTARASPGHSAEQEALHTSISARLSSTSSISVSEDLEAGPLMCNTERAPWPAPLATLMALQLGWGLWLMPAVYAK